MKTNKTKLETVPIAKPRVMNSIYADKASTGPHILPHKIISLYDANEWEVFVEEWVSVKKTEYNCIERCGGAGDLGRDVIAWPDVNNLSIWDNYQCKHYDHPLRPSEVWVEFGKLVFYSYQGLYTFPHKYFFIAPQGVGTRLSSYLRDAKKLKSELITNWDRYCSDYITTKKKIKLDEELICYIKGLDFSIFSYIPALTLIEEHKESPYHVMRFGGVLPDRPESPTPPILIDNKEIKYIRKLLDAYEDFLGNKIISLNELSSNSELDSHARDSRIEFYSAEALRSFSRDTFSEDVFGKLQEELLSGIKDEIRKIHPNGYARVLSVVQASKNLQLTSNALISRLDLRDRGGICHQLANERDDVLWVKKF